MSVIYLFFLFRRMQLMPDVLVCVGIAANYPLIHRQIAIQRHKHIDDNTTGPITREQHIKMGCINTSDKVGSSGRHKHVTYHKELCPCLKKKKERTCLDKIRRFFPGQRNCLAERRRQAMAKRRVRISSIPWEAQKQAVQAQVPV